MPSVFSSVAGFVFDVEHFDEPLEIMHVCMEQLWGNLL